PEKEELPQKQVDSLMELHFANMGRLAEAGHLLAAGPFYDNGGVFLFSTPKAITDSLVQTDPAVQADRWRVEQFTWRPLIGSVCGQPKDTEMTTYSFLRFLPTGNSWTEEQFNDQLDYVAGLPVSIVTLGLFDEGQAGMLLIFEEEPDDEHGLNAPAIQEGWYSFKMQQLYIASGSFCEREP
ncbi:MAG: hypothetical protein AAFP88_03300, partial [Bacteroidota bacterium]